MYPIKIYTDKEAYAEYYYYGCYYRECVRLGYILVGYMKCFNT
jgi:hypothetical protein